MFGFETRISAEPKRFNVPQKTLSPIVLSTGSDSPVKTDWSTEVEPLTISPSAGMVSPGKTRRTSPTRISSTGTNSSPFSVMRRASAGANSIRFLRPFFARQVVRSSRISPIAMIKATSAAANRSFIIMAAIPATDISSADEIFSTPLLTKSFRMAEYKSGKPDIITVTHAGLTGSVTSVNVNIRLAAKNTPLIAVGIMPSSASHSFLSIVFLLIDKILV